MSPTPNSSSQLAARSSQPGQSFLRAASRELRAEEGFTLAAVIVILTIMSILIAFTVPQQWSMVMKRERDRQTIFLMKQYARGILNFRVKNNNTAPVSLEQLEEAREPRLLRGKGKWPCPITGKEDGWILVPPGAVTPPGAPPIINPTGPIIGGNTNASGNSNPTPGTGSRLNAAASPDDYVGPFVGVRPKAKGKSFIAFNGAENYEEWVYTADDLTSEIAARNQPRIQ
jgi:type II secretory pathway pseudopilin PulG